MKRINKPVPSLVHQPLKQAIALALTLGTGGAQAANIFVNSAADAALPANDGNCTLREAIQAANTNTGVDACPPGAGGVDTIQFNAGLGAITLTSGQLDITETLSITGPGVGQTINGGRSSRIFSSTTGADLNLENLTLTGGVASSTGFYGYYLLPCANDSGAGGGVCSLGNIVLTNSIVSDNSTPGGVFLGSGGGGLYAGGDITLTNSNVSNNAVTGGYYFFGGGSGGGLFAGGNVILTNSTVSNNNTQSYGSGGGVYSRSNVTLTNSTISNNSTGGGYFFSGGSGGGLSSYGSVTLTNSTVSGNSTTGNFANGGGLSVSGYNSTVTLTNSTVSGNRTTGYSTGGGIFARGTVTLINSTITNNQSTSNGGGIQLGSFFPYTYTTSSLTLTSSILAANTGPGGNFVGFGDTILNASFSLFGDDSGEINGTNDSNIINNDPGLALLTDNGCAAPAGAPDTASCVQTHPLLPDSPAIDAGSNPDGLATDQRGAGFPREVDAAADIGALESGITSPVIIPTLGFWAMAILSGLLGFLGWRNHRWRRE